MAINLDEIFKKTMNRPDGPGNSSPIVKPSYNYNPSTGRNVNTNLPNTGTMSPSEMSKFLYETRLQNVFNDYQQSVATLNQQEQQSLQDAYFIRELSQKYLGEYASNVGIGDVSGNLLDIYTDYQRNITDIKQNTNQMALSLQQSYDEQSRAAFEGVLASQQMELDENAQTMVFNIRQGNTNGMEWNKYIESELAAGRISQEQFQQVYQSIYDAKIAEIESNVDRGFFGFKTDAEGNRVPMGIEEYIDSNRQWLTGTDLQRLRDYASLSQDSDGTFNFNATKPLFLTAFGVGGGDYNFTFTDKDGNISYYTSVAEPVDSDTATISVTSEDLIDAFEKEFPNAPLVSGQTTYEYKGNYFIYVETMAEGGQWYRMTNATATQKIYDDLVRNLDTAEGQKTWKTFTNNKMVNKYFTYDRSANEMTVTGGGTFVYSTTTDFALTDSTITATAPTDATLQAIRNEFIRVHVPANKKTTANNQTTVNSNFDWDTLRDTVILYQGAFYTIIHNGKLKKFVPKK